MGQLWEGRIGSGQEQTSVLNLGESGLFQEKHPTIHLQHTYPSFFVNQEVSNMFPFRKCAVPYTLAYISPILMAFVHWLCNVLCQPCSEGNSYKLGYK